jgi:hypothetical protein
MLDHYYAHAVAWCVALRRVSLAWGPACLITATCMLLRGVFACRCARVLARVSLAWGLTCVITATRMLSRRVLAVRRA